MHDTIDAREPVAGSNRILRQRVQQLLGIWHFTARDSLRTLWQASSTRRAPSLWEQAVSARDNSDTISVVYGHRRGIDATFHLGANFARFRDTDGGVRTFQA